MRITQCQLAALPCQAQMEPCLSLTLGSLGQLSPFPGAQGAGREEICLPIILPPSHRPAAIPAHLPRAPGLCRSRCWLPALDSSLGLETQVLPLPGYMTPEASLLQELALSHSLICVFSRAGHRSIQPPNLNLISAPPLSSSVTWSLCLYMSTSSSMKWGGGWPWHL